MIHLEVISNGMGAPSMYMMMMAGAGLLECDLMFTADTGSENDCLLSTGERVTAKDFYEDVIKPYCFRHRIESAFVRTVDKNGKDLPSVMESLTIKSGIHIPLFGSNGGKLRQSCTEKWKIRACRQELRRRGAKTARVALGLTMDEVHRMKPSSVKWQSVHWPLINNRLYKSGIRKELEEYGLPYMLSSQCDMCPHMDRRRWEELSIDTIDKVAKIEQTFDGDYFFTRNCIPLKKSIEQMNLQPSLFDFCDSGYCFT